MNNVSIESIKYKLKENLVFIKSSVVTLNKVYSLSETICTLFNEIIEKFDEVSEEVIKRNVMENRKFIQIVFNYYLIHMIHPFMKYIQKLEESNSESQESELFLMHILVFVT